MRRFNARLIKIILILLLFHALAGAFKLLGLNHLTFKPLSYAMLALILLHGFIGFFFPGKLFVPVWKAPIGISGKMHLSGPSAFPVC